MFVLYPNCCIGSVFYALQNFHFQLLFDTSPFLSGCLPFHTTPNSVVLISHHPGIWTDDGIGPCPTGKHRTSGMLISLVSATLAPGCSFGHFDVVEHWLGVICDAPSRMLIASEGLYYRSFKWDLHTKTPSYRLLVLVSFGLQLFQHPKTKHKKSKRKATRSLRNFVRLSNLLLQRFLCPWRSLGGSWKVFSKGVLSCVTSPKTNMVHLKMPPLGKVKKHLEIHQVFGVLNVKFLGCVYHVAETEESWDFVKSFFQLNHWIIVWHSSLSIFLTQTLSYSLFENDFHRGGSFRPAWYLRPLSILKWFLLKLLWVFLWKKRSAPYWLIHPGNLT